MDQARILLIDDDAVALEALAEMLKGRLYRVAIETTTSPLDALARLGRGGYDAVMTDIRMPEIDGVTLLCRIHALRPTLPVLLMSGHFLDDEAKRTLNGEAVAFFPKPIERNKLTVVMKRALHLSRRGHAERHGTSSFPSVTTSCSYQRNIPSDIGALGIKP